MEREIIEKSCQTGYKFDTYSNDMSQTSREIHEDFLPWLEAKEPSLIELFKDLREYMLEIYPESNEILYHTHALTAVFSLSEKLSDAFCMIPIYTNHLNLGFHKGTLLEDPDKLLEGTGKLIRHIPVRRAEDYRNDPVRMLIESAVGLAIHQMKKPTKSIGKTISKIKK